MLVKSGNKDISTGLGWPIRLKKKRLVFIVRVRACVSLHWCVQVSGGVCTGQVRTLDLELQVVVSHLICVLGTKVLHESSTGS